MPNAYFGEFCSFNQESVGYLCNLMEFSRIKSGDPAGSKQIVTGELLGCEAPKHRAPYQQQHRSRYEQQRWSRCEQQHGYRYKQQHWSWEERLCCSTNRQEKLEDLLATSLSRLRQRKSPGLRGESAAVLQPK
ncbi:hypothetical protein Q9233_011818 [Columba guinea]|nr:hypothetical protein Q9233_011818 [Columba guinea]